MGDDERVVYRETVWKNYQGGPKHARFEPKTGAIHQTKEANCPVKVIKRYISLLPPGTTRFYCYWNRNLNAAPNGCRWYDNKPIGIHGLTKIMPDIASRAGWDKSMFYSAHSLRATTASVLFDRDYPVPLIKKTTGHRSSLCKYLLNICV